MITKFGKEIVLKIVNKDGGLVFETSKLRVDFEIRILSDFNRAKFTIYNLNPDTTRLITNGDRFVKIFTKLHDGELVGLPYDFYVNNAMTIKNVPNGLTELFCIDRAKKDFTMQQANYALKSPTLLNHLDRLLKFKKGKNNYKFDVSTIPTDLLKYKPIGGGNNISVWSGSVEGKLKKLGKSYGFKTSIEGDLIKLIWQPMDRNVVASTQSSRDTYVLDTVNMRANPKIGIAKLEIDSNLDFNIKSGIILDTSELITASTSLGFKDLTVSKDILNTSVTTSTRFECLTVVHTGSNYSDEWNTKAMAVKAAKGTHTNTYGWY